VKVRFGKQAAEASDLEDIVLLWSTIIRSVIALLSICSATVAGLGQQS
jgi:hypothetical protein